jgi:dipeptidyl-peptidase-3
LPANENQLEEAHMRNRQMIAAWVFEKGKKDNVISKVTKSGKTYFVVNDYEKLRVLFGQLLREVQRIKSEGDYEAGKKLVEDYGVKVNPALHKEVLEPLPEAEHCSLPRIYSAAFATCHRQGRRYH